LTQEIIHTSAVRGLKQGSHGFCTVRSTFGMAHNLATLLEKLTAYNHAYKHLEKKVDDHPVNYVHYTTMLGGTRYHILGHVSNAPLDHTNRSNKLAHLVAFDESEIDPSNTAGPAAEALAIENNHLWRRKWDPHDQPSILRNDERITLPVAELTDPASCETWKQVTGNAKWAAELVNRGGDQPVPIIFSDSQKDHCLKLVAEALSLIPPQQRWDVTFSTYFSSSLPTKVKCRWQFLLDTTELGKKARRSLRVKAIDLPTIFAKKLQPEENELSEFAECSDRPWTRSPTTRSKSRARRRAEKVAPEQPPWEQRRPQHETVRQGEEFFQPVTEDFSDTRLPRQTSQKSIVTSWKSLPRSFQALFIFFAFISLIATGSVFWSFLGPAEEDVFSETVAQSEQSESSAGDGPERIEDDQWEASLGDRQLDEFEDGSPELDDTLLDEPVWTEPEEESLNTEPPATEPEEEEKAPAAPKRRPLDDVRDRKKRLGLPLPGSNAASVELATIYVDSVQDCSLDIVGEESILTGAVFKIRDDPGDTKRNWHIVNQPSGIGAQEDVGVFTLDGQTLSFKWDGSQDGRREGAKLRNCLLRIDAKNGFGSDHFDCILREPEKREGVALRFSSDTREITLLRKEEFKDTTNVRLEFSLHGGLSDQLRIKGKNTRSVKDTLRVNKERSTVILFEESNPSRLPSESFRADIELSLLVSKTNDTVFLRCESLLRWFELSIPDYRSSPPDPNNVSTELRLKRNLTAYNDSTLAKVIRQADDDFPKIQAWIAAIEDLRTLNRETRKLKQKEANDTNKEKAKNAREAVSALDTKYKQAGNLIQKLRQAQRTADRIKRFEDLIHRVEGDLTLHFKLTHDMPVGDGRSVEVVLVESTPD
jgi:hypothetical protein